MIERQIKNTEVMPMSCYGGGGGRGRGRRGVHKGVRVSSINDNVSFN